ncbi:VOC family protein [Pedobacter mucosus]|uniref:VOC family protein n=1 Tax=Pedobacter mucosus TaxID=2895286 RepID=UPI001EE4A0FB|nr:VOC family protein [Pedobacter mucosus]UKT62186.1 VOC family protein [Pedobacter mucosus]
MATVNTYLNFNGNTEEVFNFYKSVFGGEFIAIQYYRDAPGCEGMRISDQGKLNHIALPVGGNVLMGTDITDTMPKSTFGTEISLSVDAETEEEAHYLFNNLSNGGKVTMALEHTFWGALFGMPNFDYEKK